MTAITLRFVTSPHDPLSALIRFQAGLSMPFTPSHVEALSRDAQHYIGQHIDGGMQARPLDYSGADVLEKLVSLPCTQVQYDAFQDHCESRIGTPYDWHSIVSFIDPAWNLHQFNHLICSAEMTFALRSPRCQWFPMPLTVPFHHISPRDLLLILSSHVQIDH
jgi:hypothetical protein